MEQIKHLYRHSVFKDEVRANYIKWVEMSVDEIIGVISDYFDIGNARWFGIMSYGGSFVNGYNVLVKINGQQYKVWNDIAAEWNGTVKEYDRFDELYDM